MFRSSIAALSLLATSPAIAQTAPAPANTQGLGGNPIPGLCLLSREAIFANAAVGKAASARLKQLTDEAQAEVNAERQPIEADIRSFQTDAPKLAADARATRERALAARLQPVQDKAQLRSREIEATRAKALERISTEAQPVIQQVYRQHNCGLLVDRNSVLGGNMSNDLTADVVKALDAKISTITFNRETLPAQPAPAAPVR